MRRNLAAQKASKEKPKPVYNEVDDDFLKQLLEQVAGKDRVDMWLKKYHAWPIYLKKSFLNGKYNLQKCDWVYSGIYQEPFKDFRLFTDVLDFLSSGEFYRSCNMFAIFRNIMPEYATVLPHELDRYNDYFGNQMISIAMCFMDYLITPEQMSVMRANEIANLCMNRDYMKQLRQYKNDERNRASSSQPQTKGLLR